MTDIRGSTAGVPLRRLRVGPVLLQGDVALSLACEQEGCGFVSGAAGPPNIDCRAVAILEGGGTRSHVLTAFCVQGAAPLFRVQVPVPVAGGRESIASAARECVAFAWIEKAIISMCACTPVCSAFQFSPGQLAASARSRFRELIPRAAASASTDVAARMTAIESED